MARNRKQKRKGVATAAALAFGAAFAPEAAHAATFAVTNTNDSGAGSLRDAIAQANASAGADTINIAVTGTITLTTGELPVTESMTIDGPGSANLTISGNDNSRIFNITDNVQGTLQDVFIDGLTLTHGKSMGFGGGISSEENLTITDAVITANWANTIGGGLHQNHGSIALANVVIAANEAAGRAGMSVINGASATFSHVDVLNNHLADTSSDGAGIVVSNFGTLLIEDSTVSGNVASYRSGISLDNVSGTTTAVIRRTTVSGNTATENGGSGIQIFDSTVMIENSTISGNSAALRGGGLYLYGTNVTLRNSTVTGNSAAGEGGNIFLYAASTSITLENSVVANGVAPVDPDLGLRDGATATASYSLIETVTSAVGGTNNITGVDPQLGPLQNNGGATLTHQPAGTSPLINAGDPLFAAPPGTDQRGVTRIANGRIDIGAVEVQNILSLSSATYSVAENGGGVLTITVNRTGSSGAVSVNYATSHGTATAADYTAASGTLNWANGDTAAKTFNVAIANDNLFEGNQTFNVTLSSVTGDAVIGIASAVASITDDETQPSLSIANVVQAEGNSGTSNFTFVVTLSGASEQTVTVNYATANGTASAGSDYNASNGTVTFNSGATAQNVVVAVIGDTAAEADETFTVTLSSPVNASIASGTATGTIDADDATAAGAPQAFSATAMSASQVQLHWAPVTGAASYEIFRATTVNGVYALIGSTGSNNYLDTAVAANTTYLYKVRVTGNASFSAIDAATAMSFTDPALSNAVRIKASHIAELRTAVNAMRAAANLSPATFTDTLTAQSTRIKRVHITELRDALDAARAAIGLPALSYTDATITAGTTTAKAAHITELRAGTR